MAAVFIMCARIAQSLRANGTPQPEWRARKLQRAPRDWQHHTGTNRVSRPPWSCAANLFLYPRTSTGSCGGSCSGSCAASRRSTTGAAAAGSSASATGADPRISARFHLDPVDEAAPSVPGPAGLPGEPANSATLPAWPSRVVLLALRRKPRGYAAGTALISQRGE